MNVLVLGVLVVVVDVVSIDCVVNNLVVEVVFEVVFMCIFGAFDGFTGPIKFVALLRVRDVYGRNVD